jgi:hypothetical protein
MGYAGNRNMFGAFSRDSSRRLGVQPAVSRRETEEEQQPTLIDRAPQGFTQPLTTNEIKTGSQTQPFVKSQAFDDEPEDKRPLKPVMGMDATFEDEFEIPAFLRKKK